jgi:hypothetical protein
MKMVTFIKILNFTVQIFSIEIISKLKSFVSRYAIKNRNICFDYLSM